MDLLYVIFRDHIDNFKSDTILGNRDNVLKMVKLY